MIICFLDLWNFLIDSLELLIVMPPYWQNTTLLCTVAIKTVIQNTVVLFVYCYKFPGFPHKTFKYFWVLYSRFTEIDEQLMTKTSSAERCHASEIETARIDRYITSRSHRSGRRIRTHNSYRVKRVTYGITLLL